MTFLYVQMNGDAYYMTGDNMDIGIRKWSEEDALKLHQMSMHPYFEKQRILQYLYPDTFLHAVSLIHFYQNADPRRFMFRCITCDGNVCGFLQAEKTKEGCCELSYWLDAIEWNKGIMCKAIHLFCEEIFTNMNVIMIYARVKKENKASQHILLHNGFQCESIEHMQIYKKFK